MSEHRSGEQAARNTQGGEINTATDNLRSNPYEIYPELLPCPFCGNTIPELGNIVDEDDYGVECECGIQQICNYTRGEAIRRWNRRQVLSRKNTPAAVPAPQSEPPSQQAMEAPLECLECNRPIGPLYPVGADCAGWICPNCMRTRCRGVEAK